MQITKINCDFCEADLTYTGNCVDYRLVLANESKGHRSNSCAVTAMHISPAIKRTAHFCGLACLSEWAKDQPMMAIPDRRAQAARERAKHE